MNYSFNLIDRPWIPCTQMDGRVTELGLHETLAKSHELRSVQGDSPLETAALYRLLLAVLHSALRGPASRSKWAKLWNAKQWDMKGIDTYLSKWRSRFDLFDEERPFYQMKDERVKPRTAWQLVHGMGTANGLFDHDSIVDDVLLTCAQSARMLIVGQVFGLGGGCDPKQNLYLSSGAWTKGIIFFAEGDNLFETLMLNLLIYKDDKPMNLLGEDMPSWEMDDPFENDRDIPNGYLDYLTWQNRRLLLFPETIQGKIMVRKMTIAPGLAMNLDGFDPMKQYVKGKKDWLRLDFKENKSLWRDSHSLLRLSEKKKQEESHPPMFLDALANLIQDDILDKQRIFHYMAYGMGMDPANPQSAKIILYRSEHLPVPMSYLQPDRNDVLVGELKNAVDFADTVRSKLWGATNTLAKLIISPTADQKDGKQPDPKNVASLTAHWGVERLFWSALEVPFLEFLQDLPNDPSAMNRWKEALKRIAWESLSTAERMAGESSNALKAAVKADGVLGGGLKDLFSENEPQKEATV